MHQSIRSASAATGRARHRCAECVLRDSVNSKNGNTEELLSLHRGQGLEILWRDSLQCPSEEEYITMVNNSQSSVFVD